MNPAHHGRSIGNDRGRPTGAGLVLPDDLLALPFQIEALHLGLEPFHPFVAEPVAFDPPAAGIGRCSQIRAEFRRITRKTPTRNIANGYFRTERRIHFNRRSGEQSFHFRPRHRDSCGAGRTRDREKPGSYDQFPHYVPVSTEPPAPRTAVLNRNCGARKRKNGPQDVRAGLCQRISAIGYRYPD
jgi:hypothetical protein